MSTDEKKSNQTGVDRKRNCSLWKVLNWLQYQIKWVTEFAVQAHCWFHFRRVYFPMGPGNKEQIGTEKSSSCCIFSCTKSATSCCKWSLSSDRSTLSQSWQPSRYHTCTIWKRVGNLADHGVTSTWSSLFKDTWVVWMSIVLLKDCAVSEGQRYANTGCQWCSIFLSRCLKLLSDHATKNLPHVVIRYNFSYHGATRNTVVSPFNTDRIGLSSVQSLDTWLNMICCHLSSLHSSWLWHHHKYSSLCSDGNHSLYVI